MGGINDSLPPRELPNGFVPLLDPLPSLTNPLPADIQQLGGYKNRSVYEDLFGAIRERACEEQLFIITGSPGIGKSFCYLYFCLQLIEENLAKFVAMTTMAFDSKIIVWDVAKRKIYTYSAADATNVIDLLDDEKDAWLLLDGPNKNIQARTTRLTKGKTVWFLSPNKEIIYPLRTKAKAKIYYMPAWTAEELELCNKYLYKLSDEELRRNHDFFGGIPRYVFDKDQSTMRALIDEALELSDIMDSPQSLAKKNAFLDEFSHKLIIVEPVGLEKYRLAFASPQIQRRILQKYKENASTKLREFIRITKGKAILAVLRGKFFEEYAHDFLCEGRQIEAKNLISGEIKNIPIEKRECSWYSIKAGKITYESSVGSNPYSRPRAENQGGFDSFDNDYFFQMTVADSKEVKVQYIEKNLEQRHIALPDQSNNTVKLVIVVPDDVFPDFTKPVSFKYNATVAAPAWATYIQQYLLPIPTEATIVSSLSETPEVAEKNGAKSVAQEEIPNNTEEILIAQDDSIKT